MFKQSDIIEFINKIINQAESKDLDRAKANIDQFCNYLKQTKMADEATVDRIIKINEHINSLMELKDLGEIDISRYFEKTETPKVKQKQYEQSMSPSPHYRHYHNDFSSSNSYSSSCGGSGGYRSGC